MAKKKSSMHVVYRQITGLGEDDNIYPHINCFVTTDNMLKIKQCTHISNTSTLNAGVYIEYLPGCSPCITMSNNKCSHKLSCHVHVNLRATFHKPFLAKEVHIQKRNFSIIPFLIRVLTNIIFLVELHNHFVTVTLQTKKAIISKQLEVISKTSPQLTRTTTILDYIIEKVYRLFLYQFFSNKIGSVLLKNILDLHRDSHNNILFHK